MSLECVLIGGSQSLFADFLLNVLAVNLFSFIRVNLHECYFFSCTVLDSFTNLIKLPR